MTEEQRQTIAVLKKARKLLSKPERWTQGSYARTKDERDISPVHAGAVCFCLVGALIKVCPGDLAVRGSAKAALTHRMRAYITDWNDTHSHAQVLARFDKTIARLEMSK